MTIDKDATRKAALAARDVAAAPEGHAAAQARLRAALVPYRGRALAGYLPIKSELDPLPVMAEMAGYGPVAVPVVTARAMPLTFRRWVPEATLIEGGLGIPEPEGGEEITPEVLIVPLVAFDRAGNRMGYGGGFYDRTLEKLRAAGPVISIGYAFAAQEHPGLPLEPTDELLDLIVTDRETLGPFT